jgi:PBP1b-binding outer membrane lipoprotein LpoB
MKIRVLLLTFIAVFLWGCSTTKTSIDKQDELNKLNNISSYIENKQFQFDAEEAFPLQTTAVANTTVVLLNNTGNAVGRVRLESGYF